MSGRPPGRGCRFRAGARAWSCRSRCTTRPVNQRARRFSARSSRRCTPFPIRASRSTSRFRARESRTSSTNGSPPTPTRSISAPEARGRRSDVETEGAKLLAPVVGDALRTPRRHPHPVDAEVRPHAVERLPGLVLDHVRQRTCGTGQGHVDGGDPLGVDVDTVDQAEVHHVDPELGVNHVAQRLEHVLLLRRKLLSDARTLRRRRTRRVLRGRVRARHGIRGRVLCHCPTSMACAVASFHAIQPSRAHLILAGYFETPTNATASSSTSSSGSPVPLDCMSSRNAWLMAMASPTGLPMTRSLITDALAWLIEQPSEAYDTSSTPGSPPTSLSDTRSVTSSPQTGLT